MTFGNWFKNNWVNCIKALGATGTAVGYTGAMIHDSKNGNNCCSKYSIFPGWGNNFGMNMCGLDSLSFMNYGGFSGFGMNGMMNSQYAGNMAYMSGAQAFQDQYMQAVLSGAYQYPSANTIIPGSNIEVSANVKQEAPKVNNECASNIDANQNTDLGNALDKAMDTENGSYTFEGLTASNYKNVFSNAGKSFGAVLDTNDDGFVSEDEFVASEVEDVPTENKEAMRGYAKIAFNKIDINGDGKLDWKELAANFAAYDSYGAKINGTITNEQFKAMGEKLGTAGQNEADTQIRRAYTTLFSEESE